MTRTNKKRLAAAIGFALGVGSIGSEAALANGTVLSFDNTGGNASSFTLGLPIAISSLNGIVIGATQLATGSHAGAVNGSESPNIDNPWDLFGNTGMHLTTSPITDLGGTGNTRQLDFTGWAIAWNGVPVIGLTDSANFPSDTGIATLVCSNIACADNSTFSLSFSGHIPLDTFGGNGANGAPYSVQLQGRITSVPIPATVWLFASGVLGLAGVARARHAGPGSSSVS